MKQLTENQLLDNWQKLLQLVEDTFEGERKEKLLEMYKFFEDRMIVAPASGKEEYHYCYAGGYVNHVLHVCETALEVSKTYEKVVFICLLIKLSFFACIEIRSSFFVF